MTHPTVQRIENAFGSETARRFERATFDLSFAHMDELGKELTVKDIIANALVWRRTKEGFSYWCNLASPESRK